ncbi:Down syndrome cell adhesion molecule-like isoform X4 [Silurus meridionalis]|uniref:Down syndrome cell adhesion molecule-like isoform X4 n=1 Tax=Silurus meridionalis TaxID=175797 RepID=UPI001EEBCE6D|nr:Down syndrome cell adhesion molecule-like isoform X4 [Silurus meridionalis]
MCGFWSSVRMQVCFLLLLIQLQITEGCRLEGNRTTTKEITAYTGDSVLLPCSCTDLHTKPQSFTWEKETYTWVQISPESEQYKDRFQLVNDHSSGNLSLLISHLTVEDGGYYRCNTESEHRYIRLTVEGCTLNHETVDVTGYVGHSVLLPCSCSQLQAKPQTLKWTIYKGGNHKEIFPKDQTNHYTHRVQLFNDHHPGNLSLLISHLTVEDGGFYRCNIINSVKDIKLTVREAPKRPSPSTTTIQTTAEPDATPGLVTKSYTNPQSETPEQKKPDSKHIIISCGVVVVLLLLMIVGGVMYWKHREQRREQMGEGQTGQKTQKKQDLTKPLNSNVTSEPTLMQYTNRMILLFCMHR